MPGDDSLGEVLRRWQSGDQSAAAELYAMYHQRLVQLAQRRIGPRLRRHVQAESIMLSVIESALAGFSDKKLVRNGSGSLWNLLEKMTENKIRKRWEHFTAGKRDVRREQHPADDDAPMAEPERGDPSPEELAALADQLGRLRARLKPEDLEVFELLLTGCTYSEIARHLGCSRHQARYRAVRVQQVAESLKQK